MEQMNPMSGMALPVSAGTDEQQAAFIKQTYSHVALAVLAFVLVEYIFLSTPFIRDLALKENLAVQRMVKDIHKKIMGEDK